jgi:putative tricarboxylic transport membrane protein
MASNTTLPVGLLTGFRLAAMAASVLPNTPKNKGTGEEMQKYNLRNGDVVSGAFLAALGLYIVAQAYSWNYYNPDGPGPGFFPTWYGLLMIGLALALIIGTARKPKLQESPKNRDGSKRALITWLAFAACIATMGVLGFRLSFTLFTFFLVAFVFQRTLVAAALTSVGATAAFYIVFPVLLGVQLPIGWFGF